MELARGSADKGKGYGKIEI